MEACAFWLVRSGIETGNRAERRFAERFGQRLPTAATLDRLAHRRLVLGFPICTFAASGSDLGRKRLGPLLGLGRERDLGIHRWVIYAAYLHAHATAGRKDRAGAWINVVGLTVMIFNLLYVNYVSTGLHSYAGVS